jgi:hypothetical protein
MWNSLPLTLIVEFALFGTGIAVYLSTTSAKDGAGQYALWSLLIFLILAYLGSIFGPPPPNVHVLALGALGIWLAIPWVAWEDRHRSLV